MRSALIKVLNTHYWIPLLGPVEALAGLHLEVEVSKKTLMEVADKRL